MDCPVRLVLAAGRGGSRYVIYTADTTYGPYDWPVRKVLTLSNCSQCDLAQPACGQCIRSSRKCGGYRNQIDLVFRDQSEDVRCRAKGVKRVSEAVVLREVSQPRRPKQASQRGSPSQTASDNREIPALCTSIRISTQSQAVSFFFANYSKEWSLKHKSIYEYLPDLYARESEKSAFSSAITALGLAGLSHRRSDPALLTASGQWYASALHQTNEALLEPLVATRNETLASIVLLGLYEVSSRADNTVLHT